MIDLFLNVFLLFGDGLPGKSVKLAFQLHHLFLFSSGRLKCVSTRLLRVECVTDKTDLQIDQKSIKRCIKIEAAARTQMVAVPAAAARGRKSEGAGTVGMGTFCISSSWSQLRQQL